MAEDDDDDSFGDFKFASFPNQPFPSTSPADNNNDDEDWGDFFNHLNQINGGSTNGFLKPFDPSGVSLDPNPTQKYTSESHVNDNNGIAFQLELAPTQTLSPKKASKPSWNKPQGAIPLSIFGEQEQEEDEQPPPSPAPASNVFSQKNNNSDFVKRGPDSVRITDLISNLYNQSNGSASLSNVAAPKPSAGGILLNSNASNLNTLDSMDENEDDDGWEFKSAEWDTGNKSQNIKDKAEEKHDNGALHVGAMLDSSTGISDKAGGWHLGFEFSPSSALQGHTSPQLGQKSESNECKTGFVIFNQNFGELKNAQSGAASNQNLEAPKVADIYPTSVEVLKFDAGTPPHDTIDPSLASKSHQSDKWDFGFNFNSTSVGEDSHILESNFKTNSNQDGDNKTNASPANTNVNSDVNLFESNGSFTEIGTKHEKPQTGSENQREALPLSIFGHEMPDTEEQSLSQDLPTFVPTSPIKNSSNSRASNLSINDLIWNLYNQAENISSPSMTPRANENGIHASSGVSGANLVTGDDDFDNGFGDFMDASPATRFAHESAQKSTFNHAPQVNENGLQSPLTSLNSDLINGDDGSEDDSWEFKDAVSGTRSQGEASAINHKDLPMQLSTKLETFDYVDFYSQLKDELCNAVLFHLQNLKKAQSVAALLGEDAKAKALQEEIQEFSKILHEDNIIPNEYLSENYSPRNVYFNELLEVLKEPKFLSLASEYQLASRLSMAEKDIKSAMELLKDSVSTLRILKLGSREEQSSYLTTWSKIAFVCSQELKHGANIWKQAIQKNVHDQILSNPKGVRYIHGLGEIYRAAEIIGASAKLHKPWMLLGSIDLTSLFSLLNECYSIWSDSGLEEALSSIRNLNNFEPDGISRELVESIKYIHELDEHALQSPVISGEETTCQLSALPAGFIPGLKMVTWNGKHYFVTLANLWVNLISSDPPKK